MGDLESLLTGSQMNGYLVLAEVFLSHQFFWDSFESRFSLGSWDLRCVIFTAEHAWNINLLLLQFGFAFCPIWSPVFSLIPRAPRSVFPLHHYHINLVVLPISQRCWGICPSLPKKSGLSQGTQSPTSSRFYPFRPFSQRSTEVKKVKLPKLLDKSEMEKKSHILDFHMHCSFLAQI